MHESFITNHKEAHITIKLIKCRIRGNNHVKDLSNGWRAKAFKYKTDNVGY